MAGAAALGVALLPRIAWMLVAAALCGWLVAPEADRQGTALVLAAAAAPIPLLLPRAGLLWSVPVLAPLLGTVALAPMFVGAAALAPTAWRRAGLAAGGFLWLALGEVLTGERLLFGVSDGTLPRASWRAPSARPRRTPWHRCSPVPRWFPPSRGRALPCCFRSSFAAAGSRSICSAPPSGAAGLIAAHVALGDALAATTALDQARGAIAGPIGAALLVVAVSQMAPPAEAWRAQPVTPG